MRYCGPLSQPHASVTCRAIHSAVGSAVTPSHRMRLRSCRRTSNPYSSRNEIVRTTKRSIEAIPSAWFRRNVLQPCDGGRLRRAMYLATEVWPTSMPSLSSSPLSLSEIRSEHNGDAIRRAPPRAEWSQGPEQLWELVHPCRRTGAFVSRCNTRHTSGARERKCRLLNTTRWSRHSRLIDPIFLGPFARHCSSPVH